MPLGIVMSGSEDEGEAPLRQLSLGHVSHELTSTGSKKLSFASIESGFSAPLLSRSTALYK